MSVEKLIVEHMETWTTALQTRSTAGRGSAGKIDLYGIKKLRELILELAVRGKLVPQDPNDEPASELLKRIAAEKADLVKQGKIKKQKPLPEISEEEKPFELPEGWEWVRLGSICKKLTDGSHNPPKDAGIGYPMLSSQNIQDGYIDIDNPSRYVCEDDYHKENARTLIQKNDILLTIVGSIGRSAVVLNDCPFVLQRSVAVINTSLYSNFISNFFKAITAQNYFIENGKGTAQKGIYLGQLSLMLVPVPSLNEQKRISDRIHELMSLCDQLEQHSLTSLDAHQQLVETLLGTLTESQNADELAENWARISEHFDTLFTTEASVDALKQTILQLAVMGKLVPQDPNDEPASELLKRIEQEKALLVKDGKIKKQKPLPPISDEEKPFALPDGWVWCRIDNLFNIIIDCPHSTAKFIDKGIICLDTNSFKKGKIISNKLRYVSSGTYEERIARLRPEYRDIIFAREGSVGESVVIPHDIQCCLGQRVMLLRPSIELNSELIRNFISNPLVLDRLLALHKGIGAKHVNVKDVKNYAIAVPPKKEQDKIMHKIEFFNSLCDEVKTLIVNTQQTQLHLADALTDAAIN